MRELRGESGLISFLHLISVDGVLFECHLLVSVGICSGMSRQLQGIGVVLESGSVDSFSSNIIFPQITIRFIQGKLGCKVFHFRIPTFFYHTSSKFSSEGQLHTFKMDRQLHCHTPFN